MEWVKGQPPNFGRERVWIVAEIPSLFSEKVFSYKTFVWNGDCWNDREVIRATKWALLPLPEMEG